MTVPTDQAARDRIRTDLDATLFVEAGAGTGKTTALVGRVISLVATGRVASARELAAITFTEAAAAELRDRVREGLEAATTSLELDAEARARVERVLADVDEITVTTLHGFASRLLGEYPLEAGLPPGFEVEDEIEASVRFDRRWADLVDDLHTEPAGRAALARGLLIGLRLRRLREAASVLEDNWDRVPVDPPQPTLPAVAVEEVVAGLDDALALRSSCLDDADLLAEHLDAVAEPFRREVAILGEVGDADALLGVLARADKLTCTRGRAGNWGDAKALVAGALERAEAARQAVLAEHRQAVMAVLVGRLGRFAREGAEDRRRRGLVSYHDLLVRARDLLRDDVGVRTALAGRYRHLLIDEFQDTDPLQIEIAALLAAADPTAEPGRWDTIEVVEGKLFFVGDPKQSIYRFRRADIALYARAQEAFGADLVHLTANFRSVPAVLEWVNAVFGRLIEPEGAVQPPYVALDPSRAAGERPAVLVVGGPNEDLSAPAVREVEAAEVAALIGRMRAEGWEVGRDERAPLRYDDVALLVPTRTPLGQIERALEAAGIPYRIESRSLVFQTDEVRELLAILAAVDDPADEVALVAALRSPGLACSDADLADWRRDGGRWRLDAPVPAGLEDHPVARALAALARHHAERDHLPVSELVDRVVHERRLVELTLARRRPRDHWRRYRFVTDAARAFVEAGGTSLAEFVAWVSAQAEAGADRIETAVPEPDDEAVRIMTVHGSKGLEFPVVVLAGLNAERDPRHPLVAWGPDGPELRMGSLGAYLETAGYGAVREGDQRFEEAERIRLLYVAATRAQDHLVVSLHHRPTGRTHAERLHEVCTTCADLHERPEQGDLDLDLDVDTGPPRAVVEGDDAAAAWQAARQALLAGVRASAAVAPSGLGHDDGAGRPETDQRVPGRGEGGTARGRAVHAVLEAVALPEAGDLDDLARREADHEGLADRAEEVAALARSALAAPVVRRALAAPRHWRELPVVTRVGDRVLEGFIDLAFEDHDGALVVIDHKTDVLATDADAEQAAARYRLQLAAYVLALGQATGRPVREAWLVFARPDGAVEVRVDDLDRAVAEVEALFAEGAGG